MHDDESATAPTEREDATELNASDEVFFDDGHASSVGEPPEDQLAPTASNIGLRVAGAMLLANALLLLVEAVVAPSGGSSGFALGIVFDAGLGFGLVRGQDRWRALVLFRCVLGGIGFGLMHAVRGDYLLLAAQLLVTGALLLALVGNAGRIRAAFAVLLFAPYAAVEVVGLVALATGWAPLAEAQLDLEPGDAGTVIGELRPWHLDAPPGWRSRRSLAAREDNPLADRWISLPAWDAHVMVIVEPLEPGQPLDPDRYADAVLDNTRDALGATLVDRHYLADGSTLLHVRGQTAGVSLEQLVRCVVRPDAAYQVVGFSTPGGFAQTEDELRAMLDSFEAPGATPTVPWASYSEARAQHAGELLLRGPAPQEWEPQELPSDARVMEYRSGAHTLEAWVSADIGGAPRPAVVFLHGGFAFAREDWEMAQRFRDEGYVTMVPFLRGENGMPGDFSLYYGEVDDVVAATEALAARPGVDASRIHVTGHSSGGTLAMLAAMHSDRFRSGTSLSGYPDTFQMVRGNPELAPYDTSDPLESFVRSPSAFPSSFRCPFALYWGDDEGGYAQPLEALAAAARASGRDVSTQVVPGDHFSSPPASIEASIAFFRSH